MTNIVNVDQVVDVDVGYVVDVVDVVDVDVVDVDVDFPNSL